MRRHLRTFGLPAALLLAATLAACDSPAEKAKAHYQRGLELAAAGDPDRASVEFRNVLRLARTHAGARLHLAEILRDRGDTGDALAQYQTLVDQHPDDVAGQRELADLALEVGDFETAEIHAARAFELDPADPEIRALKASADYRRDKDRPAAVTMAADVLEALPGNVTARMVVVADRLAARDLAGAVAELDAGLAAAPGERDLHLARLATLEAQGDMAAVGAELTGMSALYPDDENIRAALVQWHMRQDDPDEAEAVLRAAADSAADADPAASGPALTLARFLLEVRGPEAARAELTDRASAAAAAGTSAQPYRKALAGLDFQAGRTDAAIAAMQALVAEAPPSDEARNMKVALAAMLAETGRTAESDELVEAVLAEDHTHVPALKLRAQAETRADHPEAAIRDMRTALTVAPRDPEVLTLMALAHERAGERDLMGERLALAVEVSNRGAAELLRYASFLLQEDRIGPAEGVVVDALRRAPEDPELLYMLGRIHLERKDWDRVGQVADLLRKSGDPDAAAMADALQARQLAGQGRSDDEVALLTRLAGAGGNADAMAELVRAQLAAGKPEAAQAYLDGVLAQDPQSLPGRYLQAGLLALGGQDDRAEALYREVVAAAPVLSEPHQALFALLAGQGRGDDAARALDQGVAAAADNSRLLFLRAGLREVRGDVPGAIADYETLYARDSTSPVVANNLASLLTAGMEGPDAPAPETAPADLERAFAIARRLQGSKVPQFQDTYGWILHLRGDDRAALDYLAPAARALPGNAQVQYHRGAAALAAGDPAAAKAAFQAALAAAGAGSPLPQADAVRAQLAALEAAPDATPEPPSGG